MHEICPLDHCRYANSPTGNCLWPGNWCPRKSERDKLTAPKKKRKRLNLSRLKQLIANEKAEKESLLRTKDYVLKKEAEAIDKKPGRKDPSILSDNTRRDKTICRRTRRV